MQSMMMLMGLVMFLVSSRVEQLEMKRQSRCFTPLFSHSKRHTVGAVADRDFNICLGLSGLT
jgi:hypothetical protein